MYLVGWVFYLLLAAGGIVWIGVAEGDLPLTLFLDPQWWWADLGLGLGAALLLILLWQGARHWFPSARELEREMAQLVAPLTREEGVALAVVSGIGEELFFRGAMQGSFGFLLTTFLFALLHNGPGRAFRIWPLFALFAGGLFGALVLWRENLLAPIVAHIVVNGVGLYRLLSPSQPSGEGDDGLPPPAGM